jgi:hypothetical protein
MHARFRAGWPAVSAASDSSQPDAEKPATPRVLSRSQSRRENRLEMLVMISFLQSRLKAASMV